MKATRLILAMALLMAFSFQAFAQDRDDDRNDRKRRRNFGTHNDFKIDLGINNFLEDGESPSDNNEPYAVRGFGSWYIAFKSINDTHIGGALHLLWGPEVSWYNFKFEDESIRLTEGPDGVVFTPSTETDVNFRKSKLTVANVGFSAVPLLRFGRKPHRSGSWFNFDRDYLDIDWDDEGGFRVGVGGYISYRLDSYTKTVVRANNDKERDRDKDGFFIENFRYGVRFQAGYRGVDVFVNYDLNNFFVENRGPELNAFSFGVIL